MQGGRIFYYDAKKNWWSRAGVPEKMPAGEPGGPDSEIFYDFGTKHDPKWGKECHPNCDCGRFLEIGNSVFMQYIKNEDGTFSLLPKQNVDFGGGLERVAAASNNDPDVFNIDIFWDIIQEKDNYGYMINRDWISYYEVRDKWISDKFVNIFGLKREPKSDVTQHHMNIAAALQNRLEEVVIKQLTHARKEFGLSKLCLAGGVALNCSMNGAIAKAGIFDEIFVQPASGDAGTAIGACYLSHVAHTGPLKPVKDHNYYLGSRFTESEIEESLKQAGVTYTRPSNLSKVVAEKLEEGKIIGWYGGAAEFGPRALGNRSLLARPFPAEMKDHINKRVKFREYFRPFAPAVLAEHASEYFQMNQESPHMLIAIDVAPDKKEKIPAVVHVDGSCRVQTVKRENNPRFRALLEAFYERTGCPVLLNTSFNVKGQPIVNTPAQAIDCFKNTNIDCLAIGDFWVEKI